MPDQLDLTKVHTAFEHYFSQGVNRTLQATSRELGVKLETLDEWHEVYNWDQHVGERIEYLQRTFSEHFHTQTMEIRSTLLDMITATLNQFMAVNGEVPFDINSVSDFAKLSKAYETMVRANAMAIKFGTEDEKPGQKKTWAELLQSLER